jgi:hypothetical protein
MTRPATRSLALALVAGLVVAGSAGCAPLAAPTGPSAPAASRAPATARPASAPPSVTPAAIPNTAILLVSRPGEDGWTVVEAATGGGYIGPDFRIPVGAPRPGWSRVVSASIRGEQTIVRDDIVEPGFGGPRITLDGRWTLPTLGDAPVPLGVSADGSTIVLVEAEPAPNAATTRLAVLEHTFAGKPSTVGDSDLRLVRVLELHGRFAYDTLSPDGRVLYVVEHLDEAAGGHYQVRAIDLPAGTMRPDVIVDKANPDEWMAGYPIAQVRRADGVVMTLYDGPEHPFVHALQSAEGWASCIDLPVTAGAERSGWGLALAPDGRTVSVANGDAGLVVELDPTDYAIRRTATLASSAAAPVVLAKFGHSEVGPLGQRLVALPGGAGLLVGTRDGVAIVNGKDLREVGRIATGGPVESIGVTPDGTLAFALTGDGRIVAFDPSGPGHTYGEVPGGPWAGLVAVAPW